ncbi:hypothetical protein RRG08_061105 [Elysia crispata]|uniref:MULE transposase domain-containing protein n=1 Tax=Elysia crispata TaxID=231223 RepID=A0AAE0Z2E8_9GAST|nr:hypothetical protein RRG08_061105 [Elysia crispata]
MELFVTERGNKGLRFNNYTYRLIEVNKKSKWFRCTKKDCPASLLTDFNEQNIVKIGKPHNHEAPSTHAKEMQTARASIKRKAEDSLNERPSKLVCSVVSSFSTITSRDLDNLTRQVRQYRLKSRPKLPKTREEVLSVLRDYDSDFIMEIDESLQICLITTVENLNFLSSSTHILADGTFQFCPRYFYQLYTFHGTRNGHFIPCVFALLPNKKEATYTRALQMLRHMCREKNVSLHSEFFHFDLEDAMLSSCGHVFPDAKIKACNFHVGQAWHRKLQQIGLAAEFQSNSETSTWLKSFFGLPALDPHEMMKLKTALLLS